jgi:hypothetical protein
VNVSAPTVVVTQVVKVEVTSVRVEVEQVVVLVSVVVFEVVQVKVLVVDVDVVVSVVYSEVLKVEHIVDLPRSVTADNGGSYVVDTVVDAGIVTVSKVVTQKL